MLCATAAAISPIAANVSAITRRFSCRSINPLALLTAQNSVANRNSPDARVTIQIQRNKPWIVSSNVPGYL